MIFENEKKTYYRSKNAACQHATKGMLQVWITFIEFLLRIATKFHIFKGVWWFFIDLFWALHFDIEIEFQSKYRCIKNSHTFLPRAQTSRLLDCSWNTFECTHHPINHCHDTLSFASCDNNSSNAFLSDLSIWSGYICKGYKSTNIIFYHCTPCKNEVCAFTVEGNRY